MELQVARVKKQAQVDHWKKLKASDEPIALLKERMYGNWGEHKRWWSQV